jgi:hypothetical protein
VVSRARAGVAAGGSAMPAQAKTRSLQEVARWRLDSLDSLPAES